MTDEGTQVEGKIVDDQNEAEHEESALKLVIKLKRKKRKEKRIKKKLKENKLSPKE